MKTHKITFRDHVITVPETGLSDAASRAWRKGKFYECGYRNALLSTLYNWNNDPDHKYFQRFTGKTAIDVGASVGNHSIFFNVCLGMHVKAFEPEPERFKWLDMLQDIKSGCFAIGKKPGKCNVRPTEGGSYEINERGRKIEMRTLDEYAFDPVAVIKIDVEGYEPKVLRGARETIARHKPIICAESNTQEDFEAVAAIMEEYGYQLGFPVGLNHDQNVWIWEPKK